MLGHVSYGTFRKHSLPLYPGKVAYPCIRCSKFVGGDGTRAIE